MIVGTNRKKLYVAAVNRAADWVLAHQESDGGFGPNVETMGHQAIAPLMLLYTGHAEEALRVMPYVKRRFVRSDGSFDMPEIRAGRASSLTEYCYAPSWMIYSAHLCLAFDVSLGAMPHLLKFQDPQTGGMFGKLEDSEQQTGIINTAVTCIGGQAALVTGYLPEARRMADHIVDNVLANNSDMSRAFYPIWHTEHGVLTGEDTPNLPNVPAVILRNEPGQHHYLTGMTIGFLTDTYRAFGESKYLDAAEMVYEFATSGGSATHQNSLSHKLAWGCAWLYRATGKAEHLESACHVCDYLLNCQEEDGSFVHWGIVKSSKEWTYSPRLNITAQFALWISRTANLL